MKRTPGSVRLGGSVLFDEKDRPLAVILHSYKPPTKGRPSRDWDAHAPAWTPEAQANGRRLALAWNTHDAMVELLRRAADMAGEMLSLGEEWQEAARDLLARIEKGGA